MMWRRTILTAILMGGCIVCFLMAPEASSQASGVAKRRGPFKPVAPVIALMEAQDQHFEQMKEQIGSEQDSRFKTLETEAEILAELANVNRYHEDKDDYIQWCDKMRETSLAVAWAAKAKDLDKAKKLISQINKNCCNACHDVYQ